MESNIDMVQENKKQNESDNTELLEVLKSIDRSLRRIADCYVQGIHD